MPDDTGDGGDVGADASTRRTALGERRGADYAVYQPAEDSALLAGEIVADLADRNPGRLLDVGTGSGYVGARVAAETGAAVVGSDINPEACRRAQERGLAVVRGNLVEPFADGAFDVVAFNPPYLPAMEAAGWEDWFDVAISGGETGRETIVEFMAAVDRVLAPGGSVYLLVSSLTGVDAIVERAADAGFSAVALADATFPGETLTVLKLVR